MLRSGTAARGVEQRRAGDGRGIMPNWRFWPFLRRGTATKSVTRRTNRGDVTENSESGLHGQRRGGFVTHAFTCERAIWANAQRDCFHVRSLRRRVLAIDGMVESAARHAGGQSRSGAAGDLPLRQPRRSGKRAFRPARRYQRGGYHELRHAKANRICWTRRQGDVRRRRHVIEEGTSGTESQGESRRVNTVRRIWRPTRAGAGAIMGPTRRRIIRIGHGAMRGHDRMVSMHVEALRPLCCALAQRSERRAHRGARRFCSYRELVSLFRPHADDLEACAMSDTFEPARAARIRIRSRRRRTACPLGDGAAHPQRGTAGSKKFGLARRQVPGA